MLSIRSAPATCFTAPSPSPWRRIPTSGRRYGLRLPPPRSSAAASAAAWLRRAATKSRRSWREVADGNDRNPAYNSEIYRESPETAASRLFMEPHSSAVSVASDHIPCDCKQGITRLANSEKIVSSINIQGIPIGRSAKRPKITSGDRQVAVGQCNHIYEAHRAKYHLAERSCHVDHVFQAEVPDHRPTHPRLGERIG